MLPAAHVDETSNILTAAVGGDRHTHLLIPQSGFKLAGLYEGNTAIFQILITEPFKVQTVRLRYVALHAF